MPSKAELENERRTQILDAAEKVFAEQGFSQARMDDIVAESGLSKGALYWYYKSKDAIIMALMDRVFISEMKAAEALIGLDSPVEERIRTYMRAAVRDIRHFEHFMNLGYEFVALATRRSDVREKIKGYYATYTDILTEIIQEGIDRGELRAVDPVQVAISIIGVYEGITLMWFVDPASVDWDVMTDSPLDLFFEGIRKGAA
jgi:AcrR family transcriptional regulator